MWGAMNPRMLKAGMQAFSLGAGMVGVWFCCLLGSGIIRKGVQELDPFAVLLLSLLLIPSLYAIFVAYLIWLRFSPKAVLHLCGLLGFLSLGMLWALIPDRRHEEWDEIAVLVSGILVIWGYRALSRFFNRLLFQAGVAFPGQPTVVQDERS